MTLNGTLLTLSSIGVLAGAGVLRQRGLLGSRSVRADTLAAIRALPMKTRIVEGEWRVTFHGLSKAREEALAFYTDDPGDALQTARAMAAAGVRGRRR